MISFQPASVNAQCSPFMSHFLYGMHKREADLRCNLILLGGLFSFLLERVAMNIVSSVALPFTLGKILRAN